jgi:hypothetical protein
MSDPLERHRRIQRAEQHERRDDLELVLHGFEITNTDLDRLATLAVDPRALHHALASTREVWHEHQADEDTRRRDKAAKETLRRAKLPLAGWRSHWRQAPQPTKPGNPVLTIRNMLDQYLKNVLGVDERDLREHLIGAACRSNWRYLYLPPSVVLAV